MGMAQGNPNMGPAMGQMSGQMQGLMPGQMGMPPMQGSMSYPGQQQGAPMMHGQGQAAQQPWPAQQPARKSIQFSGQILLLVIVGVICLAIFITGIVLFATTKF